MEALWFPILVLLLALGPAVLIAPFGVKRAFTRGWIVPLGIYAFLLASYLGKGALGGTRYYGSVMPFICLAMARAIEAPSRWRAHLRALVLVSLLSTTAIAFVRLHATASSRAQTLYDAEARMNSRD